MNQEGHIMHAWARDLWPINRSLTGEGVRETLAYLKKLLPGLSINEIATGTSVYDWTVPEEWHCRDAYLITPKGEKICSYQENNLQLMGYSEPVNLKLPLEKLKGHLYTDKSQPESIPYVTSYYSRRWGFCLSQKDYESLDDGEYHVVVDSDIFPGVLNYAELLIPGKSDKEILLSTYICHPSLANNELSGPVMVASLGQWLLKNQEGLRYSYRLVFVPETIGAISYISQNEETLKEKVVGGYVVTCVGDDRTYSLVHSPYGDTVSDRIAKRVLVESGKSFESYPYSKGGSDERQYCSANVRLPMASICRSLYGYYPEYHTSADDLDNVVTPSGLQGAFDVYRKCLQYFEDLEEPPRGTKRALRVGCPRLICKGEPQLGKRGLYDFRPKGAEDDRFLLLKIIAYCDGSNTPSDIANILNADAAQCQDFIDVLHEHGLVSYIGPGLGESIDEV